MSSKIEAATGWTVWPSNPGKNNGFFSLLKHPGRLWGRRNLVFSEYEGVFSGLKRPGHDVNHLLPSSAEINNGYSYTSTLLLSLHGVYRETFTFAINLSKPTGYVMHQQV